MNVDDFKKQILTRPIEEFTHDVMLSGDALRVRAQDVAYIAQRLAETFHVEKDSVRLWIVGSAKLGFSITEKHLHNGTVLPRFRAYRADSDIDVAVICPEIFDAIWADLSGYAYRTRRLPWHSGQLGHYLVHGWLRPDHFPRARLQRCDDWWNVFRQLSRNSRFGRRAVRGAAFYSLEDLTHYQSRSVAECRQALELGL